MRLPYYSFLGFVAVGSALTSGFTIGIYLAGTAGSGSTSTRPSCKLQGVSCIPNSLSRFQRSSLFRLRMLRQVTTAALLLTMCSPVLVLEPSQQPSIQSTASFCSGPAVLCGLKQDLLTERWNLLIEWFTSDALVCCPSVTANVECRQSPYCMTYKPLQD